MLKNLKDYRPEKVEFALTDAVKEKFPLVLFDECKSEKEIDEIIKTVSEKFNATFPENETSFRLMDSHEIQEVREEYCVLQENEVPKRMTELSEAIEEAKQMKKNAEDRYNSLLTTIRDLAARVTNGTAEMPLSSKNTFKIALCGYFLYYSCVDGQFMLAKAEPVAEWDKGTLWSNEDNNRKAMKELFGLDFPEPDRKDYDEEEDKEDDDEMPFGDE